MKDEDELVLWNHLFGNMFRHLVECHFEAFIK